MRAVTGASEGPVTPRPLLLLGRASRGLVQALPSSSASSPSVSPLLFSFVILVFRILGPFASLTGYLPPASSRPWLCGQ